jgi:hypothetical protein
MALEVSTIAVADASRVARHGVDDWVQTGYLSLGGIAE